MDSLAKLVKFKVKQEGSKVTVVINADKLFRKRDEAMKRKLLK